MASFLHQQMRSKLSRLNASSRCRSLRRALDQLQSRTPWSARLFHPRRWWTRTVEAEHRAWQNAAIPQPVPYEELSPFQPWAAGQPVAMSSGSHQHLAYVRLEGLHFAPRWLGHDLQGRHVPPCRLTSRDPRQVWDNGFELQLAQTLLTTEAPLDWLQELDEREEPELHELLQLAIEELDTRPDPQQSTSTQLLATAPAGAGGSGRRSTALLWDRSHGEL